MSLETIGRHERDARDALAEVLERRGADIEHRWLGALKRELELRDMSLSDLRRAAARHLRCREGR